MIALVLAFGASVAWAISDFLGGVKSRTLHLLTVLVVSQSAGLLVVVVVVVALGEAAPDRRSALYAVLAGASGVAGIAAFYRGLAVGAMAVVAPVSALSALAPVAVGLALGERPSALQYVGMAAALGGGVLVSLEPGETERRLATGAGIALVAALGFAGFFVGIDAAESGGLAWAVLIVRLTSTALVVALALVLRPPLALGRAHWPALVAVGVLDMSANALFAAAAGRGYVSLVSVLAGLYPVWVIALARILLGERLSRLRQAGAAAALGGVTLIATG
ncbi:MAG: EamA family transporter [Gaiellaceae bacterium]